MCRLWRDILPAHGCLCRFLTGNRPRQEIVDFVAPLGNLCKKAIDLLYAGGIYTLNMPIQANVYANNNFLILNNSLITAPLKIKKYLISLYRTKQRNIIPCLIPLIKVKEYMLRFDHWFLEGLLAVLKLTIEEFLKHFTNCIINEKSLYYNNRYYENCWTNAHNNISFFSESPYYTPHERARRFAELRKKQLANIPYYVDRRYDTNESLFLIFIMEAETMHFATMTPLDRTTSSTLIRRLQGKGTMEMYKALLPVVHKPIQLLCLFDHPLDWNRVVRDYKIDSTNVKDIISIGHVPTLRYLHERNGLFRSVHLEFAIRCNNHEAAVFLASVCLVNLLRLQKIAVNKAYKAVEDFHSTHFKK